MKKYYYIDAEWLMGDGSYPAEKQINALMKLYQNDRNFDHDNWEVVVTDNGTEVFVEILSKTDFAYFEKSDLLFSDLFDAYMGWLAEGWQDVDSGHVKKRCGWVILLDDRAGAAMDFELSEPPAEIDGDIVVPGHWVETWFDYNVNLWCAEVNSVDSDGEITESETLYDDGMNKSPLFKTRQDAIDAGVEYYAKNIQ